jgi:hypothetical protein
MGLNFVERLVLKHYWSITMKNFKRWVPLIAVTFLALHTLAHDLGYHTADATLTTISGVIPIEDQSPVPAADLADAIGKLTAAVAALAGVGMKVKSILDAIKQAGDPPQPGTTVSLTSEGETVGEAVVTKMNPPKAMIQNQRSGKYLVGHAWRPSVLFASFLLSLAQPARAGDFNVFTYLTQHASVATGALVVDGQTHKVAELRFVDDFKITDKVRGAARVGLFSLTRAGESAPSPRVPTSLEEVKAYSDGEVWLSVYRELKPGISIECIGGLTFKMTSITGTVGDPLDGTKAAGACGPRLSHLDYHVSVLGGHYGPVAESGKLMGFVPNVLIHAYLPMKFLGSNTAFTPDIALGATKAAVSDPDQRRTISKSIRLLISTRF